MDPITWLQCTACAFGDHDACRGGLCNCLEDHAGDDAVIRGFKRIKRMTPAEREAWIRGEAQASTDG